MEWKCLAISMFIKTRANCRDTRFNAGTSHFRIFLRLNAVGVFLFYFAPASIVINKEKTWKVWKKSAVYICTDNSKGSDQTFRSRMCAWSVRNFIVQNFTCGKNVYIHCGRHSIGVSAARLISHEHVSGQWLNKRCIDNLSVKFSTLISYVASFESIAFKCI